MTTTPIASVKAGRHRCTRPRTLHLIDLENLLGGRIDPHAVATLWNHYRELTAMRWDDHVIVAVSRRHALDTFTALPATVQRVVGPNSPDGADHALLDAIDIDWAARRFGQVIVATGDHIFTDTARRLAATGLQLVQVLGLGYTATDLYHQCPTQLHLPTPRRRAPHPVAAA